MEDDALRRGDSFHEKKRDGSWLACLGFEAFLKSEEISSFDGTLRCDDSAEKNGLRSLEACRVLSSDERGFRRCLVQWRQGGGG